MGSAGEWNFLEFGFTNPSYSGTHRRAFLVPGADLKGQCNLSRQGKKHVAQDTWEMMLRTACQMYGIWEGRRFCATISNCKLVAFIMCQAVSIPGFRICRVGLVFGSEKCQPHQLLHRWGLSSRGIMDLDTVITVLEGTLLLQ